jgi:type IV pilus assembly protein PilM
MNFVAIDVGANTVKVAEFLIPKEGVLTLNRFAMGELGLDPNKEENRAPFVTKTVVELLRQAGIKTSRAGLSLAGHAVFIRFVKLPPVDAMQVQQMIGFEAQQNVPFPIEEVVWDYQFMASRTGGGETEAIIAAMKTDQLEAEHEALFRAGLKLSLIDVAPLALYNAYRYT